MSKESELGKLGEELAIAFLKEHDHTILEHNYVWEKSEIDIIAIKNDKIIFVEVKTRQSPYLSDPALMVPIRKWKQIMKAADVYIKEREGEFKTQFDIVHVVTNKDYTKIEHYDEAFTPGVSQ
jgi:putative endonuclease